MKNNILVVDVSRIVFGSGNQPKEHSLYRKEIQVSAALQVPFMCILDSLRFLYGSDVTISFKLKEYESK